MKKIKDKDEIAAVAFSVVYAAFMISMNFWLPIIANAQEPTPTPVPIRDHILTEANNAPTVFIGRMLIAVADDVTTGNLRLFVRRIGRELIKVKSVNGPDFAGLYDDSGFAGRAAMLKSARGQRARRRARADAAAVAAKTAEDEVSLE